MKTIVLILIVLAAGKIGAQVYIRQQSIEATILTAYREHAIAACRQSSSYYAPPPAYGTDAAAPAVGEIVDVRLSVGKKDLDVRLWQTNNKYWSARYRDPFIVVETRTPTGVSVCEYDINNGRIFGTQTASAPFATG